MQARKRAAAGEGERSLGRRITHLVDQRFKITEADGAIYDIEHLLSVTMTYDSLQAFPLHMGYSVVRSPRHTRERDA